MIDFCKRPVIGSTAAGTPKRPNSTRRIQFFPVVTHFLSLVYELSSPKCDYPFLSTPLQKSINSPSEPLPTKRQAKVPSPVLDSKYLLALWSLPLLLSLTCLLIPRQHDSL